MHNLSLLDFAFIAWETAKTPMHVMGLVVLDPPKDRQATYAQDLYSHFLSHDTAVAPFNYILDWSFAGKPRWKSSRSFNIEDHVRITMLPSPGSEKQLHQVIGRIHAQVLDRSRPMWEVWVIGGVEGGKVALALKAHHSMVDGVKATGLFNESCAPTMDDSFEKVFWQLDIGSNRHRRRQEAHITDTLLKTASKASKQLTALPSMFKLGSKLALKAAKLADCDLTVPFTAPKTPLNWSPKRSRALTTGQFSIAQLKHISHITGASMNDVLYTISDIALNRYLRDRSVRLTKPLVAMMPISLRRDGESKAVKGNKMAIGHVELGKANLTALERLESIQHATTDLKREALDISPEAFLNYSQLINGISLFSGLFGLNSVIPPASNLLISNVPGVDKQLYYLGAKVETQYPISLLMPGQTLNITFYSYKKKMAFSLVACNQSLPGFEVIADYMCEAFEEIEQEVLTMAAQAVNEQIIEHEENVSAVDIAVAAAEQAMSPEDPEFERLFAEKQRKVEELEQQLAKLTQMLEQQAEQEAKEEKEAEPA